MRFWVKPSIEPQLFMEQLTPLKDIYSITFYYYEPGYFSQEPHRHTYEYNWIHIHMQLQNVEVKVGNSKEYFPTWPHPCSYKFHLPRIAIPCANCDLPSSLSALPLKVQHLSLANSSGHCVPPPVAVWKSKLGMWCSSRKGKKTCHGYRKVMEHVLLLHVGSTKREHHSHRVSPATSSSLPPRRAADSATACVNNLNVNNWELDSMLPASFMITELDQLSY